MLIGFAENNTVRADARKGDEMMLGTWTGLVANPWRELSQIQREVNRLFDDQARCRSSYPLLNIWSNEDGAVLSAQVPGIDPENLNIEVKGNIVRFEGERPDAVEADEKTQIHRCERGCGSFSRTLRLPFDVETDAVKANYRNGILRVTLPRLEASKPKRIEVTQ
jgi:HSP20 family protein